jgi:hypothetical protein
MSVSDDGQIYCAMRINIESSGLAIKTTIGPGNQRISGFGHPRIIA